MAKHNEIFTNTDGKSKTKASDTIMHKLKTPYSKHLSHSMAWAPYNIIGIGTKLFSTKYYTGVRTIITCKFPAASVSGKILSCSLFKHDIKFPLPNQTVANGLLTY